MHSTISRTLTTTSFLLVAACARPAPTLDAPAPPHKVAVQQLTHECQGCHTPARTQPAGKLSIGLGQWRDASCYGCHAEIDDVAKHVRASGFDRRAMGLPVRRARLLSMEHEPLSYLDAPSALDVVVDGLPRLDADRLTAFLQRPVPRTRGAPSWMMAFPGLEDARPVLGALGAVSTSESEQPAPSASAREAGTRVWESTCAQCHERGVQGAPSPAYLSLFTPAWVEAYANGKAKRADVARQMPTLSVTTEEARGLVELFAEARASRARAVDTRVAALATVVADKVAQAAPLTAAETRALWSGALREGKCVHCHTGTENRARTYFEASPEGLAAYAEAKGGLALWRRLETRAIEHELGIGAQQPGMPMTAPPVSPALRALFFRWAVHGCADERGHLHCKKLDGRA